MHLDFRNKKVNFRFYTRGYKGYISNTYCCAGTPSEAEGATG